MLIKKVEKIQKLLYKINIIVLVLAFLYVLIFFSNFAFSEDIDEEFYKKAQLYNHFLNYFVVFLFVLLVICYVQGNHKRKIYFKSNNILTIINIALYILFGIANIVFDIMFINKYNKIIEESGEILHDKAYSFDIIISNFPYIYGIIISILLMAMAVAYIIFLKYKKITSQKYLEFLYGEDRTVLDYYD